MIVLLPPSESKSPPPRRGRPVDLATLSFPALNTTRSAVLDALVRTSAAPDALQRLGVGASLAAEVGRNTRLRELPAVPASAVYTGVLYDALGWPTLSPGAKRRAASRLIVISALWGALRPGDRVPSYRLSMDGDLSTSGGLLVNGGLAAAGYPTAAAGPVSLAKTWRDVLAPVLTEAAGERGLVVDCRSSTYAQVWTPTEELADRTVAVRVLRDGPGGRTVVSHMAKHTRGEVARHLLESSTDPGTPKRLAAVLGRRWSGANGSVELVPPPRPGRSWGVDIVLP